MTNLPPVLAFCIVLVTGFISTSILHRSLLFKSLSSRNEPGREGGLWEERNKLSALNGLNQVQREVLATFDKSVNASMSGEPGVAGTRKARTLIAITAKGNLQHTLMALSYLTTVPLRLKRTFDIMVIDDFSDKKDRLASYVRQRGFFCVSKSEPRGLTDSWNVAFEHAVRWDYDQLILANNDALLGPIALELMQQLLDEHVIVVPLTTPIGSGHAPAQNVLRFLESSTDLSREGAEGIDDLSKFVHNIRNDMVIGAFLRATYGRQTVLATYRGKLRFNGFLLGLNVSTVQRYLAYSPMRLLNEKDLPMVGQEDELARKLEGLQALSTEGERRAGGPSLQPVIALGAYAFHFKSVTIAQGYQRLRSRLKGDMRGVKVGGRLDYRNNLTLYQDEEEEGRGNDEIARLQQVDSVLPTMGLYPPINVKASPHAPKASHECLAHAREAALRNSPFRRAACDSSSPRVTVAFAISNPHKTPRAGDIMTANELGSALETDFDVSVEYLHRGMAWYDPGRLADLDIVIAMLDAYDPAKALSAVAPLCGDSSPSCSDGILSAAGWSPVQSSPRLVMVAWARNWFDRWLLSPTLGHYDMILVSSTPALLVFQHASGTVGLPMRCQAGCPRPRHANATDALDAGTAHHSNRRAVPIARLLLATNESRFSSPRTHGQMAESGGNTGNENRSIDYVAPMGYYRAHRSIMTSFDPSSPSLRGLQGVLVGPNWNIAFGDPAKWTPANTTINRNDSSTFARITAWRGIYRGDVRYEQLPALYRDAKLVLDDANAVTLPWGSVNSRVFDALAAGALVVTNGEDGLLDLFGHIKMVDALVYRSSEDLDAALRGLAGVPAPAPLPSSLRSHRGKLGHPTLSPYEQNELLTALHAEVLQRHTYHHRAQELRRHLGELGVNLPSQNAAQPPPPPPPPRRRQEDVERLCLGIRTIPSQFDWLQVQLTSLALQLREMMSEQSAASEAKAVDLRVVIVDTGSITSSDRHRLVGIVDSVNTESSSISGGSHVHLLYDPLSYLRANGNKTSRTKQSGPVISPIYYGYPESDALLAVLAAEDSGCTWIGLTNGDNTVNRHWLRTLVPHLAKTSIDLLAYDFVSHHPRGERHTNIRVELAERGKVDLASVVARTPLVRRVQSHTLGRPFMPQGIHTTQVFARDYFYARELLSQARPNSTKILHQTLVFHQ